MVLVAAASLPYSGDSQPPQRIRRGYPPNLSISLSGGQETKQDSLSSGERTGTSSAPKPSTGDRRRRGCKARDDAGCPQRARRAVDSGCSRVQPKAGGKSHLNLNTTTRPIANKYREGKLKRTLKREFNRT
ncbi:hypothetical protein M514_28109 [Trichuris suis]|uniref:Uncharacterized protein n=1 Tax=Trichuris suis TaxID=68888 RepID=A0A085MR63_9BILA|nr:hypothetical protein M514_28109 [Trichuris suis]